MPQNSLQTLPWLLKIFAVTIGAIIALTLSGDIDTDGKLDLSLSVLLKLVSSAAFGLFGGAFLIEHMGWSYTIIGESFISMLVSVFGLLAVGILYQSVALMRGKSLPEVVTEVKATIAAIFNK